MIVRDLVTKLSFLVDPKGLEKLDQQLAQVRGTLLAVGAAGTAAFAVLAKMAAKQEEAFLRAAQESNLSSDAVMRLSEDLRVMGGEISARLGASAEEVASVFDKALNRGLVATDQRFKDVTEAMIRFGKVTKQDAGGAFELLGKISQQFFGNFDEVENIGNVLRQTTLETAADLGELQAAVLKLAPQAVRTGTSLEGVSAVVGALAEAGVPAKKAMSAIITVMDAMTAPTEEVRGVMEQLNIELSDAATGKPKDLIEIIGELEQRMVGLNHIQRDYVLSTIAGTQGVTIFNALLQKGSANLRNLQKRVTGSNIINQQFNELMTTLNFQTTIATQSLTQLGASIGVALLGPLTRVAEMVGAAARRVRAWIEENRELASAITIVTASIFALLTVLGTLSFVFAFASKAIAFFTLMFSPLMVKVLLIGAVIAGLILIIEDLYQWATGGDSVFKRMAQAWAQAVSEFINSRPVLRDMIDFLTMIAQTAFAIPKLFGDIARAFDNLVAGNFSEAFKNLTQGGFATDVGTAFDGMRSRMAVTEGVRNTQATVNISNLQVPPGTDPQDVGNVVGDKVVGYLESLRMARTEFEPQMVQ